MLNLIRLHALRALSLVTGCAFTAGYLTCAAFCGIAFDYAIAHGTDRLRRAYAHDSLPTFVPTDAQMLLLLALVFTCGACLAVYLTLRSHAAFRVPLARARARVAYRTRIIQYRRAGRHVFPC